MIGLIGVLIAQTLQDKPEFDLSQRQAIHDALYIANLTEADLRTDGLTVPASPFIAQLHSNSIHSIAAQGIKGLDEIETKNPISKARKKLLSEELSKKQGRTREIYFPEDVPFGLRPPLKALIDATLDATEEVKGATAQLSSIEKRRLVEGLPGLALHFSLMRLDFVRERPVSWAQQIELIARVDFVRIRNASAILFDQIEKIIPVLSSAAPSSFQSKIRFSVDGVPIVLAGFADDYHQDKDAGLTIDLGGNDRYAGRHGVGVGYASVFVDLDGSDTYTTPDLSLGAGLLGIGLAWDIGGEDVVRGKSICLGSGIAGVGAFIARGQLDSRGAYGPDESDLYECASMGQGFGLYGLGILSDRGGNDTYRSQYLSQGAALTAGVGILDEELGNDHFFADGLAPSLESDATLRARSQGFGGQISASHGQHGGIGQLVDENGVDVYVAGSESQGCGLDGGFGLLVDRHEDDTYRNAGYGQGFGLRAGVGSLIDALGDDQYICSQGSAQGVAVETGIGYLLDWKGRDLYTIASGSPGSGSYGGLGIVLDLEGFDRYSSGADRPLMPLESAGIGLWLDLGGANQLSVAALSPVGGIGGVYSVVALLESRREIDTAIEPDIKPAAAPITPEEVEVTIAEAAGTADYATRTMRSQARANLAAFPKGILIWLGELERPLSLSESRLLGEVIREAPAESQTEFFTLIQSQNFRVANNALKVVSESGWNGAGPAILQSLQREGTAAEAAKATRMLGLREAFPDLMLLCASKDARTRREASISLSRLGGAESVPTGIALLAGDDPIVRQAAVELIGRIGVSNIESLKTLASNGTESGMRAAIQALGAIGTPETLEFVGNKLSDARAGVRIDALRALAGRCPRGFRTEFEARKEDADSRVRAVALSLDPGR